MGNEEKSPLQTARYILNTVLIISMYVGGVIVGLAIVAGIVFLTFNRLRQTPAEIEKLKTELAVQAKALESASKPIFVTNTVTKTVYLTVTNYQLVTIYRTNISLVKVPVMMPSYVEVAKMPSAEKLAQDRLKLRADRLAILGINVDWQTTPEDKLISLEREWYEKQGLLKFYRQSFASGF